LGVESLGLLLEECGDGALGQSSRSGGSNSLHGWEVERLLGARLTESLFRDAFAPLSSEIVDFLKLFC